MIRKCKAGQRARIITDSSNNGKIVLVVGPYFGGEEWGGSTSWAGCIFPWKAISLGAPIQIYNADTNELLRNSSYCVIEDENLEPLDDDDDGLTRSTDKEKPKPKAKERTGKPVTN